MNVLILTPVYDDWECFLNLLEDMAALDLDSGINMAVLAINDSPAAPRLPPHLTLPPGMIERVEVLHLVRNVGHQRAIAVGLVEAFQQARADVVVVMDGDGEDRPGDILRLIAAHRAKPDHIILAARGKQSKNWRFVLFYRLYQLIFRVLTGHPINHGNFSLIPASLLEPLVTNGDVWNHFGAAIMKAGLPTISISAARGQRYSGRSKMRFTALILHGLSAIAVYSEVVLVRLLLGAVGLFLAALAAMILALAATWGAGWTVPGWVLYAAGGLVLVSLLSMTFISAQIFTVLHRRSQPDMLPLREAPTLVKKRERLLPAAEPESPASN